MRTPFQKLVEMIDNETDQDITMGAQKYGEPVERIMDAIDAGRMLRGEQTYIPTDEDRRKA